MRFIPKNPFIEAEPVDLITNLGQTVKMWKVVLFAGDALISDGVFSSLFKLDGERKQLEEGGNSGTR